MLVLFTIGLLLRPFPKNVKFYGKFKRCRNNPCPRPHCTYAHTDLELREWNGEKKAESSTCKLQKYLLIIFI